MKPSPRLVLSALLAALVPLAPACGDDADDTDAPATTAADPGSENGGTSGTGSAGTSQESFAGGVTFEVPSDWQSFGEGAQGSMEYTADGVNISVRDPEARSNLYGSAVATGGDLATVAAAEAQVLGAQGDPEVEGSVATAELEVGGAEAIVIVVDLGNGEFASVYASAGGSGELDDGTRESLQQVAASLATG